MGIGAGVFLAAIGAILAFAVDDTVDGVDLVAIGYILMAAGAIGILLDLIVFGPRRRVGTTTSVAEERRSPGASVVEERRVYDDGSPRI